MKLFPSLLLLGTFTVVTANHVQAQDGRPVGGGSGSATQDAVDSMSGIHRPTPTPGASAGSTSKPTGPLAVELAKDAKGKSATTAFTPNDTVYFICTNVSAEKGDKIGVAWYGGKKERKVYGTESAAPNKGVYNPSFNLPPPKGGSPAGTYRVELLLNSKALKSMKFTVQ